MSAFVRACRAEWRKMATVSSTWISTVLAVLLSLIVAGMGAWGIRIMYGNIRGTAPGSDVGPLVADIVPGMQVATMGLLQLGLFILMIQSALTSTVEYSTGTVAPTTLATPRRWIVVAAKAVVCGLWAAATALVTLLACLVAVKLLLPGAVSGNVGPFAPGAGNLYWAFPLLAFLCAVLCVGVGLVLRSPALAVTVVLLWRFVLEPLAPALPRIGDAVGPWMPFSGAFRYVDHLSGGVLDKTLLPWPAPWSGMAWFAVVAVAVLAAGALAYARRPASTGE
ncbi:hypothetical protein [Corynebacterium sp. 335C]